MSLPTRASGFLQAPAHRAGPASKLILCRLSDIISRPLIGQKYEYYIVIEVIEVDELDEVNISLSSSTSMTISVVAGKQEN